MTTKEYKAITQALKKVPHSPQWQSTLDPEVAERMRARVMAFVMEHGGQPSKQLSFIQKLRMNLNITARLVPQGFAYGLALFALLFGSGAFAAYAQRALPGQTLYGAKIALEQTHARFVSNPADRARVQMEFAGRRLEEAKAVESQEQVTEAIKRFSKDVKQAKETLKQASDPVQIKAAQQEITEKAQEYEVKLAETRMKPVREVGVAAIPVVDKEMQEAEDALKEVAEPQKIDTDNTEEDELLKDGEVGL
ncbi:hypothetical protein A3B21_04740 [Candidatus Uhrbacteria bacterium RIFCSPLOWO2_01_FULL_47_24]|uniref:DUF5667 domain-containing protein n=1 Tax=Candidatus Uhrbacteria bacterium RIFCSPLOWO2_01_FULL_47_24 TaxID=1802401 RepID=A0A1F7UTZ1_9BACT|nr:MAG: hypothetical protein A2753_01930 [Candidatus Uhrbacteria bacterium RIFCSPHIGHO2_01_FULL_47_11]OGL75932.1 MAG: hypothetical protein A3F52_02625 [Candidatus Uhrbacteria bacterium RIFCSPHIGHO2_12_FULL_47_11]OGL81726.1 MAG: hypothetical protein A3B21_04740 [Candidatus Uhrbacteria bacterium RIFCSPLOWO2_01_FULL_47_24]OGL85021.1 MAG: hypothetical protein A3J03_03580 [Candidatus Uhrbacteria bacterium RIFCSPLOWO2_02_FULL_46_25]OGL91746.1 MAG: hypothetical protein A3H11_01240 [Candidatus Uhrbacte